MEISLRQRGIDDSDAVIWVSSIQLSQLTSLDQDEVGPIKTLVGKPPLRIKPTEEKEYRLC